MRALQTDHLLFTQLSTTTLAGAPGEAGRAATTQCEPTWRRRPQMLAPASRSRALTSQATPAGLLISTTPTDKTDALLGSSATQATLYGEGPGSLRRCSLSRAERGSGPHEGPPASPTTRCCPQPHPPPPPSHHTGPQGLQNYVNTFKQYANTGPLQVQEIGESAWRSARRARRPPAPLPRPPAIRAPT